MDSPSSNMKMITKLLFKLLPVQIFLNAVGAVNGIVSSFFASNYVGIDAMSAVGLYSPINMLMNALSMMLVGGSVILCGQYMGRNEHDKQKNVFSLSIIVSALVAGVFIVAFVVMGSFDLTGFLTKDTTVRPLFNQYLLGQSVGLFPLIMGNQLAAFLSLENKGNRTMIASFAHIVVNVILNYLFVQVLKMEAFGLALSAALGLWVFLAVQSEYFLAGKSYMGFTLKNLRWGEVLVIISVGLPGALSFIYQAARGIILNMILENHVGTVGISAFAAADNFLRIFWAVPIGMLAVSRMLISVSIGEEDRQTLTDIMRVMFKRFIPLQCIISALLIICAVPITMIFFRDPAEPVYMMMVWGLRILPICMPLSIINMHFTCYGQVSGKHGLVHTLSLLDGVVCVAGFSAILVPFIGQNGAYIANVLNGVVTTIVIIGYSWIRNKYFPKNMEQLMVVPKEFGVPETERMDITVNSIEEVVNISKQVQNFCAEKGIDKRRSYLAGLAMEEMAGNIVDHGFTKDKKKHSIDVRVVHKDGKVILRLKDDCVPFDPKQRSTFVEGDDIIKNIGIRMIYKIAGDIKYQNIFGLNVLTINI